MIPRKPASFGGSGKADIFFIKVEFPKVFPIFGPEVGPVLRKADKTWALRTCGDAVAETRRTQQQGWFGKSLLILRKSFEPGPTTGLAQHTAFKGPFPTHSEKHPFLGNQQEWEETSKGNGDEYDQIYYLHVWKYHMKPIIIYN